MREAVNTNNAVMITFFDRMTIAPEGSRGNKIVGKNPTSLQ